MEQVYLGRGFWGSKRIKSVCPLHVEIHIFFWGGEISTRTDLGAPSRSNRLAFFNGKPVFFWEKLLGISIQEGVLGLQRGTKSGCPLQPTGGNPFSGRNHLELVSTVGLGRGFRFQRGQIGMPFTTGNPFGGTNHWILVQEGVLGLHSRGVKSVCPIYSRNPFFGGGITLNQYRKGFRAPQESNRYALYKGKSVLGGKLLGFSIGTFRGFGALKGSN